MGVYTSARKVFTLVSSSPGCSAEGLWPGARGGHCSLLAELIQVLTFTPDKALVGILAGVLASSLSGSYREGGVILEPPCTSRARDSSGVS